MTETVERTATGAILYDRAIINQITERHFLPQGWPHAERLSGKLGSGGRGNTMLVGNVPRQFVLRHYRRGGMIGKLVRDRYFWTGEDETRSFAEWRLLAKMADFDLRVPRPAAARYIRRGTFYTADLITVRIPRVRPLSMVISEKNRGARFWRLLGAGIREFHVAGVYHADMNAYNLQIDSKDRLWMLDFDKGSLKEPGPWQQQTLDRLRRSLRKIKSLDPQLHFARRNWDLLLEGYFEASKSA
ncbi:MAG: 3-deoxy-D-manno-octulosonic acid kinase [Woeseiaceae bacterium]|nr:3-deoxy-D-manno-octulosonic acid kinase [Woeseiaceae bacterium]